ncbi:hypothetical protein [Sorangium sp. So ce131]|uniref:hypothetical protein n=1 Tax=Sorangium sp. So ce131 TaxID=3133282 RepID=UPI003F61B98F
MRTARSMFTLAITTAAALGAVTLKAGTAAAASACHDFSGLAAGTTFGVGAVVPALNATAAFTPFEFPGGGWTFGGFAEIVASNNAAGSPAQELEENNINLALVFNTPSDWVRFRYADLGGNVNLAVNGDFVNVPNLSALNGVVLGGALIDVNFVVGAGIERGRVTITPLAGAVITDVRVGGQEFYLDDLCRHW